MTVMEYDGEISIDKSMDSQVFAPSANTGNARFWE